ncbi:MAG: hypothetical protein V7603_328 [Micromonosporaceae bacterium]
MEHGMVWWIVGFATSVIGGALTVASVRLLGRVRAAASWPTAPPVGRAGRATARAGAATGLVLLAVASGLLAVWLARPVHVMGWLIPTAAAGTVLLAGGMIAVKMAERAELSALIRTPPAAKWIPAQDHRPGPPAGQVQDGISGRAASTLLSGADPAVPSDGRPGWVYRDAGGDWYLAVAADVPGQRLVRLADFALVPAGAAGAPLDLAGSVQISVYPVEDVQPAGPAPGTA